MKDKEINGNSSQFDLIECPRDAMQGIMDFIPTKSKIEYLNLLLKIGFHTLDFGSFVSHKAIPQLADTSKIVDQLDTDHSNTKLLAIIANERGAKDAVQFEKIDFLGFPFSISETFQKRNTNSGIDDAFRRVEKIQKICTDANKILVVYFSMGFGNPYGDPYNLKILSHWATKMKKVGIQIISISDTIGVSNFEKIDMVYKSIAPKFPSINFGLHLHSIASERTAKIKAAYNSGCKRIDSAMLGMGGCPMAKDDLTGNISTESVIEFLNTKDEMPHLNMDAFFEAQQLARSIFEKYH